jgi:hypothetical protein
MLAAASDTANPDQYQYQADHFQAAHYAAATAAAAAAAAAGAPAPTQHYARYQGTLLAGQQTPAAAAQQYTAATGQQYPGAAITVGQACELPSLHLKVALRTWAKLRFPSTYRYVSLSIFFVLSMRADSNRLATHSASGEPDCRGLEAEPHQRDMHNTPIPRGAQWPDQNSMGVEPTHLLGVLQRLPAQRTLCIKLRLVIHS